MQSGHAFADKVLLVEDDFRLAHDLALKLRTSGVDVLGPVANVKDALRVIGSEPKLCAAVLDINLGDHNVFPVADELRRRRLPYVFATAYSADILPVHHADVALFEKPIDVAKIVKAFQTLQTRSAILQHCQQNKLLSRLPADELAALQELLTVTPLAQGTTIEQAGRSVDHAFFLTGGFASAVVQSPDGKQAEIGIVGKEGFTGYGLSVGDRSTPFELVMQANGTGLRISADDFQASLTQLPTLLTLTRRFERCFGIQAAYNSLSNAKYNIERRLARWILMIQDRLEQDVLMFTHDFMGAMLGVRRSSITDAIHVLEGLRLVRSVRGKLKVRNRKGLIDFAQGAYGPAEQEYQRLLGSDWAEDIDAGAAIMPGSLRLG